jgi:hypothetical protein
MRHYLAALRQHDESFEQARMQLLYGAWLLAPLVALATIRVRRQELTGTRSGPDRRSIPAA